MVAFPLTYSLPDDATMVNHDSGQSNHLQKRRPAARRMLSDDSDTYRSIRSVTPSAWPRQRYDLRGDGVGRSSSPPPRRLAAATRFFFAEEKTLHGEYVPNYRYTSLLSSPQPAWLTPFVRYWPILSGLIVPFAILLEGTSR